MKWKCLLQQINLGPLNDWCWMSKKICNSASTLWPSVPSVNCHEGPVLLCALFTILFTAITILIIQAWPVSEVKKNNNFWVFFIFLSQTLTVNFFLSFCQKMTLVHSVYNFTESYYLYNSIIMVYLFIFITRLKLIHTFLFILIYFKMVLFVKWTILIKTVYIYKYIYICWQTTWLLLVDNYFTVINMKYLYV